MPHLPREMRQRQVITNPAPDTKGLVECSKRGVREGLQAETSRGKMFVLDQIVSKQ